MSRVVDAFKNQEAGFLAQPHIGWRGHSASVGHRPHPGNLSPLRGIPAKTKIRQCKKTRDFTSLHSANSRTHSLPYKITKSVLVPHIRGIIPS